MKNIMTVLSARASYSRVRSVLLSLKQREDIISHVVLIASAASPKYGKLEDFLMEDDITINWKIESQSDASLNSSMVRTTSSSMIGLVEYILNFKIDGVLAIADRHETISGTIASSFLNLKTFHLLGGELSGNIDNKVRFANSFLSDYHFVATQESKIRLERCGIPANTIFNTGCPSLDYVNESIKIDIKNNDLGGVGFELSKLFSSEFIVVIQHAETTSNLSPRQQVRVTIEAIDSLNIPTLWIWPNSDSGSDEIIREISAARESGKLKSVHFERSIAPKLFLSILNNSKCVVGNSSVAIRECSLLGVPAVNIGRRQINRERAENVVDVDYNKRVIVDTIRSQIKIKKFSPSNVYGEGNSGIKIANYIADLLN